MLWHAKSGKKAKPKTTNTYTPKGLRIDASRGRDSDAESRRTAQVGRTQVSRATYPLSSLQFDSWGRLDRFCFWRHADFFKRRILRCEKNIRDWARYDQKKNLQQLNPVSPTAARTAECFARSRRRNLKYKFKFLRVVKSSIKNRTRETDNRSETLSINTPDCDILTN